MKPLVRQRLAGTRPPRDVVAEAAARLRGTFPVDEWMARGPMRPAAVLVPLMDRPSGLAVLLTERNADLPEHPGQIAFPGGRLELGDADAVAAALRECEEEVGIPPAAVEVIGFLGAHMTLTGYAVTPVVGLVRPDIALALDAREVASAFEVPLAYLLDPTTQRSETREAFGRRYTLPYWEHDGRRIWGATAYMLADLRRLLAEAAA